MTQYDYIMILFDGCGFNGPQRRDFLGSRFGGRRYADQLTATEQHALIEDLKERKVKPIPVEEDEDENAELTAKQRADRKRKSA